MKVVGNYLWENILSNQDSGFAAKVYKIIYSTLNAYFIKRLSNLNLLKYLSVLDEELNKFEKRAFLESMDRTNKQSKLMDIMRYSDQVKYELETDYTIKEFASKIPILGVIFTLFGDFSMEFLSDNLPLIIGVIVSFIVEEILVANVKVKK